MKTLLNDSSSNRLLRDRRRHGDRETRRHGEHHPLLLVSLSPCLPVFSPALRRATWLVALLLLLLALAPARAIDQAKPGAPVDPHAGMDMPQSNGIDAASAQFAAQDRTAFEQGIHLDDFRLLAVQHLDQVKIVDSWARQSLYTIRHRTSLDGKDGLLIALDMAFRPEAWLNKNIIYVESVPIRDELGRMTTPAEAQRIHADALVSPSFLQQDAVQRRLDNLALDARQLPSVNKVRNAFYTFLNLAPTLQLLPPTPDRRGTPWVFPGDVELAEQVRPPATLPAELADLPPYPAEQRLHISLAIEKLATGWRSNDVSMANQGLAELARVGPAIDPAAYPTATKRTVELWYNRTYSGTLVAFVYFVAMVLFFMVAVGVTKTAGKLRRVALGFFVLALALHLTAMGVRWWLNGRIPIQNQFESVMGSACLGCLIGLALESWKKNGIFGAGFAFVGFLATTVMLAAPYVFGTDLGAAGGRVAGILNTGWLYIHVNIVIASYALILASAAIALIFLGLRQWFWVNPLEPGIEGEESGAGASDGNSGSVRGSTTAPSLQQLAIIQRDRQLTLDTLDQANMVVLQMAFWMLGVGILCGAVWADQSWGRPWGWDPKETFALVTWIVYLVIVHVRLIIKQKSDTTALLALAGCGIMLFNWIGVNFWLVGLHSYA